jgi:quercetin dioxygenase-like cupin family protein
MLRLHWLFAGALFGACSGASAQVPMEKEPRHHVVFENEALRVVEPSIPAGDTTLEHLHVHDDTTVCISGSHMRARRSGADWSPVGEPCRPGQINVTEYAGKPASHTVQNTGAGVFHLVVVENLREAGWSTNPPLSAVATALAKETRAFEIYEVRLDNSSRETSHVHNKPTIVVLVSGDVTAGKQQLGQPGRWVLIPADQPHRLSTKSEAKIVEIEVR